MNSAQTFLRMLDRFLEGVTRWTSLLVLPLSLLLFLQWPLREVLHAGSREANDLAQILFALYVSVGVNAATRGGAHLAADVVARRYRPALKGALARALAAFVLLPWALLLFWFEWPILLAAWREKEAFAETLNPGYFLVKTGVAVLALLVALQALREALAGRERNA